MGLKTVLFNLLMLIYIKLTYSHIYNLCNAHLKPKNLSYIPLNIENEMISLLFLNKLYFEDFGYSSLILPFTQNLCVRPMPHLVVLGHI